MGRNALSIRTHGSGRGFFRFVAIAALMLASGPSGAFQRLTTGLKQEGRTPAGNYRSGSTDDHSIPRVDLFHVAPRAPQQPAGRFAAESQGGPKMFVDMTPAELTRVVPELKQLKPTKNQDTLPLILQRVGATVADFFNNFSTATCTEHVTSAVDTPMASMAHHYDLKFNYVALAEAGTDKTRLREYRTDSKGEPVQIRGAVVTLGFVAMPALFHPDYQRDSRFQYLGREQWKGQSSLVVAFAQRPGVARQAGRVTFDERAGFVFEQGVAWIDPVNFRIIRLRTDIEQPELKVGLQRETTEVEYSEMTFKEGGKKLWVPREVTVIGELNKYKFHNRHSYSDYRLFVVRTEEKPKSP